MGISSLPSPSEGMLCIILVNTALSISMMKSIIRSILGFFGISFTSPESADSPSESIHCRSNPSDDYVEDFRNRTPTILFKNVCACPLIEQIDECEHEHECSVCLNEFDPESEINHLSCGHIFHNTCLEKWLKYWNSTCPLCRKALLMIPEDETACIW